MRVIDNQEQFDKFCDTLSQEKILFMDTEFHRRRTYYAKLSLVQIATITEKVVIDVLAVKNITSLKEILLSEKICKVFHAPDQDIDIFYHLFGKLPNNIFDTQIAAGVIGFNEVTGYSKLCKALLNINIDKTMQNANWLERPLPEELIIYAIKDVEYLIPLYRELVSALNSRNLWESYNARSKKLLDPESYKLVPERFIKRAGLQDRSDKFKENYVHLLMLREECAKEIDIPRRYCASEEDLVKICETLPTTDKELMQLHIFNAALAQKKHFKNKLFELCLGLQEQIE